MPPPCPKCRRTSDEGGFTLVEMVIAVALGAIVFTALAAYMSSGLRVLAVQKARTQGNEIATQAIEDLQRLDDEYLGLCVPASPAYTSPPAPPDFHSLSPVELPHCGNPVVHDPCNPPGSPTGVQNLVPDDEYDCVRLGSITYTVKRYVAWASSARLSKRLAAHVTWTDSGRSHEVFQASTRTTSSPPAVKAGSVNSAPSLAFNIDGDGSPATAVTLRAVTTGLTNPTVSGDAVRAFFTYRDPSNIPRTVAVSLGSINGIDWEAPIDTFKLPPGKQYVIFTAVRAEDKKEGSGGVASLETTCAFVVVPCPLSPPRPPPPTVSAPTLTYDPAVGSGPNIDSAGALVSEEVRVSVTTTNVTSSGIVTAILPTVGGGARTMPLKLGAAPCAAATNCWGTVLTREAAGAKGYRFSNTPAGSVLAMAAQGVAFGSTAVSPPMAVTFE